MIVFYALLALLAVCAALLLVAIVRTLLLTPRTAQYEPVTDPERTRLYSEKLSRLLRVETVSRRGAPDPEKFRGFHRVLEEQFPRVFTACEKVEIDGNLLLKWPGRSSADPILLMSHMDVVPADGEWEHPPFSGDIEDGLIWGRGASDTKCSLMAFYQAVEELLEEGYVPACDVYLASSCTEEIGGDGAPKLANWLKEHGIHLAMLCDEGGGLIDQPMAGVPGRFAMIGVFEKGYGDVRFIARGQGGHASAPAKGTPIPRLAQFVTDVEKKSPFTARFSPETRALFLRTAPYAEKFWMRCLFWNLWLFEPLLTRIMPSLSASAAAMLQTTIAFTMQKGSDGFNVLPQEASVWANLRFIPHQSTDESLALLDALAKAHGLEMEVLYKGWPSPSVDIDGAPFRLVEDVVHKVFPGAGIMPFVVTGGTDARFYKDVCDNCIRFSPMLFGPRQIAGMHGLNETISCEALQGGVDYYKAIIRGQEGGLH